jgi:C-5 cytosine-specific DNA methylase
MSEKPECIDLYCGLGGWTDAFLDEGYNCTGYDIEAHDYGTGGYSGTLKLRDIRSIHGSEFAHATIIVGSSPCQEFSYRAMPWSRAKAMPPPYLGMELFNAQFRIQREASEAAGRYIPMVVENVRGAQKYVGGARWHYGSFYLWGDVPALMPTTFTMKVNNIPKHPREDFGWNHSNELQGARRDGMKHDGSGWTEKGSLISHNRLVSNQGVKQAGISGVRANGKGDKWFQDGVARHGSRNSSRKMASAMIAKIPYPLAQHIARCYYPQTAGRELELVAS